MYLFPEDETSSHYIGRLVSAYSDEQSPDPLCIEASLEAERSVSEGRALYNTVSPCAGASVHAACACAEAHVLYSLKELDFSKML